MFRGNTHVLLAVVQHSPHVLQTPKKTLRGAVRVQRVKLEDAEPVHAMLRQHPSVLTAHGRVHMTSKSSFFEIRKWSKIVCRQLC